jgi:hypothetical protein
MKFEEFYMDYSFNKENDNKYRNMNYKDILELTIKIANELPTADFDNSTFFDFYVNSTMQGGPHPCVNYECRKKNLERTLRFVALYAERLVLVNPFEALSAEMINNQQSIDYYRFCLMNEIEIMKFLKPFIEKGIVKYGRSQIHLCKDCLEEKILNKSNVDGFITNMLSKMEDEYLKQIEVKFTDMFGFPFLKIKCPEEINPHAEFNIELNKEWLKENYNKYHLYDNKILDKEIIKDIGLLSELNFDIYNNIIFGNYYSLTYGTQNLTDNQFEFEMNNQYKNRNTNDYIIDIFEQSIPFLLDVGVSDILELRYSENDSFENYREAVKKAVNEVKNLENSIQKAEAFSDIIRPGILQVENKIKSIRSSLFKILKRDILIAGGSLYLASNNTLFDPNITNYISVLGGLASIGDIISTSKNIISPENLVKEEPLYFLWKLKKKCS